MANPYEDRTGDPGWGGPRAIALSMVLPFIAVGHAGVRGQGDSLMLMRLLFVYFAQALGLMAIVVIVLDFTESVPGGDVDTTVAALAITAVGGAGLVLSRVVPPKLDCTTAASLVGSYRTRFFIRLALGEAGAMAGFVGFMLTGEPLLYLYGLGFAAIGFSWAAPTTRSLDRDQEALSWSGCGRPLVPTLRGLSD